MSRLSNEQLNVIALENYVEFSKKIEDVMRMKSDLSQVDNSQENPLDEIAITSAKGIKKKQGCKGRSRIKSCTKVAKKNEEKYQQSSPTSKSVYTCNSVKTLYYVSHLYTLYYVSHLYMLLI